MAPKGNEVMGLVLVLVVMSWGGANAQSGCTNALIGLSSCLNYVSGNSSTPSSTCCSQLASVVQSQPRCLCSLLNGGGSVLGVTINQTLALALPGACNVQTPPVSQCSAANGPVTSAATPPSSPGKSPADSSHETPQTPKTPSASNAPSGAAGGSKAVPSTNGLPSGGNNIKAPLHLAVLVFFIVSSVSKVFGF